MAAYAPSDRALSRAARILQDPRKLAAMLEQFRMPHAVLSAPVAQNRWGTRVTLAEEDVRSERAVIRFPWPALVLGFVPVVTKDSVGGSFTVEDIDVPIDIDTKDRITAQSEATTNTANDGTFVSLASISLQAPQPTLWMLMLTSPQPEVGFIFRSRYADSSGSNLGDDAIISVDALVSKLDREEG